MRFVLHAIFVLATASAQTPPATDLPELPKIHTSIVITAKPLQPDLDLRNSEVFQQTLFSRDDQVFHQLNGGINAGQHEGGGKSIEIRRFGFNLDHGGVSGGLKVLVDNVQQNQTTQGHGQGYLGSLKSLTPELIQEAQMVNGPFSAEYGDFSGLGVVHIRMRESMPDEWTAKVQGGSFGSKRGFLAYSPVLREIDSFLSYEGAFTDGPFVKPLGYRRDNMTANVTRHLQNGRSFAVKFNGGRNGFHSSGQIPLELVNSGRLDRFGYLDSGDGGHVRAATLAAYFRQEQENGAVWKVDGFVTRSLFDLFSNFTFFQNDRVNGDAIQQHDSRLVEGANAQYLRPHRLFGSMSVLTVGGNLHANQINVALYPRSGRVPLGVTSRDHANVSNGAGYVQESLNLLGNRLQVVGGLRYDNFVYDISGVAQSQGRVQPKLGLAFTPWHDVPVSLHANYGRGISSIDARSILARHDGTRVATTDFYQVGTSHHFSRFAISADAFWIDRSNELVFIPDDGTLEFFGPTRSYGYEAKASVEITKRLSWNGGVTKVLNAFYRGTEPRSYVDRAPHFTANAGLTLSNWRGWSGSVRMRAINHYRLDPDDHTIRAAGHTVWDGSVLRRLNRHMDFSFAIDNFTDRSYYETQNLVESRPYRDGPSLVGVHATPGYPLTVTVGMTFRFRGK
ncbi:MAG: TonB-dependent receptor [Acidobacteria bacterium]|nr:TonB-dependent receptor [Acidobacteriota bacterium]